MDKEFLMKLLIETHKENLTKIKREILIQRFCNKIIELLNEDLQERLSLQLSAKVLSNKIKNGSNQLKTLSSFFAEVEDIVNLELMIEEDETN